jgi:hypothetical protein
MKYGCRNENVGIEKLHPYWDVPARSVRSALTLQVSTTISRLQSIAFSSSHRPTKRRMYNLDAPLFAKHRGFGPCIYRGDVYRIAQTLGFEVQVLLRQYCCRSPLHRASEPTFLILKILHLHNPSRNCLLQTSSGSKKRNKSQKGFYDCV